MLTIPLSSDPWLYPSPVYGLQLSTKLLIVSKTLHFATGTIVADSQEPATGLMVITSGSIAAEIPTSSSAKSENTSPVDEKSQTLLYIFTRG